MEGKSLGRQSSHHLEAVMKRVLHLERNSTALQGSDSLSSPWSLCAQRNSQAGCARKNEGSHRAPTGMLLLYPLKPHKLYRFCVGDHYGKRKSITDDR